MLVVDAHCHASWNRPPKLHQNLGHLQEGLCRSTELGELEGAVQLLRDSPGDYAVDCEYLLLKVIKTMVMQQVTGTRLKVELSDGKETVSAVLAVHVSYQVARTNLDGELVWITRFQRNRLSWQSRQTCLIAYT